MVNVQSDLTVNIFSVLSLLLVAGVALSQLRLLLMRSSGPKEVSAMKVLTKVLHKDLPLNQDYLKPRKKSAKRSKATLTPLPLVEYDPNNDAHKVALYMMIAHQRLHPTLRFTFDTSLFDSAYHFCLLRQAEASIPKHLREAADNIVRRHLNKMKPKAVRKSKKKVGSRKPAGARSTTNAKFPKKKDLLTAETSKENSGGVIVTLNKNHAVN